MRLIIWQHLMYMFYLNLATKVILFRSKPSDKLGAACIKSANIKALCGAEADAETAASWSSVQDRLDFLLLFFVCFSRRLSASHNSV